jgi:hypothetical protein
MLAPSRLVSLFFTSATLLQLCTAQSFIPLEAVAYLTNCQQSDNGATVAFSEVSMYQSLGNSLNGQVPDQLEDTPLGQVAAWEAGQITWSYDSGFPPIANTFTEFINGNAQSPAIPVNAPVGCAEYGSALSATEWQTFTFQCFKDQPRTLYTSGDKECTTVYYCERAEGHCPLLHASESLKHLMCWKSC